MAKTKDIFICSSCDAQSPKWSGRCLECGAWGTLTQTQTPGAHARTSAPSVQANTSRVVSFDSFTAHAQQRMSTGIPEVDRVLGGGIVEGSLTLLGGEPGIGKSTLVLQIAQQLKQPVLYASGEESANQVKLRVDRLGYTLDNVSFVAEHMIQQIVALARELTPRLLIIDSIQTLYSSELPAEPGSVNQVRACTVQLLELAKQHGIATLIIGHVTKEGQVAGPKTLEHLVDSVLYIEGSKNDQYRIVRPVKNRFGSTDEIGVFEMTTHGLVEVNNPSELFFSPTATLSSGTVNTIALEGSRPFIVEIQALVTKTQFGYPQRKAAGLDLNRLHMLIAVLMKRTQLKLEAHDVHSNVTGGFKITETAADLAVCLALASSLHDRVPDGPLLAIGEVGLGGEIRPVAQLNKRIDEARRVGFTKIIVPKTTSLPKDPSLFPVSNLKEALDAL